MPPGTIGARATSRRSPNTGWPLSRPSPSCYAPDRLNEYDQLEAALRELIDLRPGDLDPVFRLAKAQEDRKLIEAAEDTLLTARRQHPDDVEPFRRLAQFYARRATAMSGVEESQQPQSPQAAGQPDDHGVYRVGGGISPPTRLDRAVYPPEAQAAGIEGAVVAEVVIDPSGDVVDARVVRSIPLLDEAALAAVRNWHFAPTLVNGQAVPVRMTVTVNRRVSLKASTRHSVDPSPGTPK